MLITMRGAWQTNFVAHVLSLSMPIMMLASMLVALATPSTVSAAPQTLSMSGEHVRFSPAISPRDAWPPRTVNGMWQVTASNPEGTGATTIGQLTSMQLQLNPPGTGIGALEALGAAFLGFHPNTSPFGAPLSTTRTVLGSFGTFPTGNGTGTTMFRSNPLGTLLPGNILGTGPNSVTAMLPPAKLGAVNPLTGHVLVTVDTGTAQPSVMMPLQALNNFNKGTSTRGIPLGIFAPSILNELTTRHNVVWPIIHPAITQTGTPTASLQIKLQGTATFAKRSPPITTGTPNPTTLTPTADGLVPASFLWCPGPGFACVDKADAGNAVKAGIRYFPRPGFSRFGGTGGQLRLRPRGLSPGENGGVLITRAAAQGAGFIPANSAFGTVVITKPITAADPANPRPQNVGLPLGMVQFSQAPGGIFYSANTVGPPLNLVLSLAPTPFQISDGQGGLTTAVGTPLDGTRYGGPLTTGTIVVSVEANAQGAQETQIDIGADGRGTDGLGALTMVGGAITTGVSGTNTNWERVTLTFTPEPATMLGAGSVLVALLGCGVMARRRD
jgi:hypothetical protein